MAQPVRQCNCTDRPHTAQATEQITSCGDMQCEGRYLGRLNGSLKLTDVAQNAVFGPDSTPAQANLTEIAMRFGPPLCWGADASRRVPLAVQPTAEFVGASCPCLRPELECAIANMTQPEEISYHGTVLGGLVIDSDAESTSQMSPRDELFRGSTDVAFGDDGEFVSQGAWRPLGLTGEWDINIPSESLLTEPDANPFDFFRPSMVNLLGSLHSGVPIYLFTQPPMEFDILDEQSNEPQSQEQEQEQEQQQQGDEWVQVQQEQEDEWVQVQQQQEDEWVQL